MQHFTSLTEAEAALEPFSPARLKRFAYTTEHVQEFMHLIGDPQNIPRAFHIAGTSGKTSTAYYTASLLQQAGKRTGLLVSPHVETITERVQIDLRPMPEREFCDELALFLELVRRSKVTLTYAEIMYAFAYWEFVRQGVEYIVVETGMGGLLDATNIITRQDKICIITDIGYDHMNVLGRTLPEIAAHKAGIIRQHSTVFCHLQPDEVMTVVRRTCERYQADLHIMSNFTAPEFLPLFQRRNFSLADRAVSFILERSGSPLTAEQKQAAAHIAIPGRMEIFQVGGKTIILDGAHNPQKLQALRQSLAEQYPDMRCAVLCAFTDTKGRNLQELVDGIAPFASYVLATGLPESSHHRTGRNPDDIVAASERAGIPAAAIADPAAAYRTLLERPEPTVVVTGSLYLLEVIRPLVRQMA